MVGKRFTDTFFETKRIVALVTGRAMAPLGLGAAQVALLRALGRSGPTTQCSLARATVIDPSAAARAFTVLARRGWIRRRKGDVDRRESYIALTALGRRLLRRVELIYAQSADLIESRLDAGDIRDLERIRTKLVPLADDAIVEPVRRQRGR
jgi:DNA-binding MarR family transcriptional regulator